MGMSRSQAEGPLLEYDPGQFQEPTGATLGFCNPRPDLVSCLEQWNELWFEDCEKTEFQKAQHAPCPEARKPIGHRRCCLRLAWAHKSTCREETQAPPPKVICSLPKTFQGRGQMSLWLCRPRCACGQTFHCVSNLLRHTSEKSCCELCEQTFDLKDRLVYTGPRPYKCGVGGKAFNQESNLLRHQLVHSARGLSTVLSAARTSTLRRTSATTSGSTVVRSPIPALSVGRPSGGPGASASIRGCT
ncbi:Zinc finger protein 707 [Fukomys damarensis]|uniref:Zinc finger protein 707 n=1 Tax=Fukomys damarensis TaxID=885580 RepID=A0A091D638_FUKDA|nr:Zinc finger protein 707 [Fukomys damarensis]